MNLNPYTDPTVSYIMRNLAAGLADFNTKAEAAFAQTVQPISLAVPSEVPPAVSSREGDTPSYPLGCQEGKP